MLLLAAVGSAIVLLPSIAVARQPFISQFTHVSTLASTVPASGPALGDQNPDGAAVVPQTTGKLLRADVLVSNFNNAQNQQGTGSSIVEVLPSHGSSSAFAVVPQPTPTPAADLTTALAALPDG